MEAWLWLFNTDTLRMMLRDAHAVEAQPANAPEARQAAYIAAIQIEVELKARGE